MTKQFLKTAVIYLAVLCLFLGCRKHKFNDTLPTVSIVSVAPYGNDSVTVTGTILTAGIGKIDYVGFCYDSNANPDFTMNQTLLQGTTGSFSAVMPAYHDSTYYFRSFAANEFGYAASTIVKYTVP